MSTNENNRPLYPFRDSDGVYLTSKRLREWEKWGYSYEDTTKITSYDSLVSTITALYSDTAGGGGNRGAV